MHLMCRHQVRIEKELRYPVTVSSWGLGLISNTLPFVKRQEWQYLDYGQELLLVLTKLLVLLSVSSVLFDPLFLGYFGIRFSEILALSKLRSRSSKSRSTSSIPKQIRQTCFNEQEVHRATLRHACCKHGWMAMYSFSWPWLASMGKDKHCNQSQFRKRTSEQVLCTCN